MALNQLARRKKRQAQNKKKQKTQKSSRRTARVAPLDRADSFSWGCSLFYSYITGHRRDYYTRGF